MTLNRKSILLGVPTQVIGILVCIISVTELNHEAATAQGLLPSQSVGSYFVPGSLGRQPYQVTYPAADSIVAIKLDDSIDPAAFAGVTAALDAEYRPWTYGLNFWIYRYMVPSNFDSIKSTLESFPEVLHVYPVIETPYGDNAYALDRIRTLVKPGISDQQVAAVLNDLGLEMTSRHPPGDRRCVLTKIRKDSLDIFRTSVALYESGLVVFAQPDFIVHTRSSHLPNDPDFSDQWHHLNNPSDADIDADLAWDIEMGSSRVSIGFLDKGYIWSHPDLAGIDRYAEWDVGGRRWDYDDPDNSTTVVCPVSKDEPYSLCCYWPYIDMCVHGTRTLGMMSATIDNRTYVTGIAPGCRVTPIKTVADDNDLHQIEDWVKALKWLLYVNRGDSDNLPPEANPSLDGTPVPVVSCQVYLGIEDAEVTMWLDSLYNDGILFVVAAGNHGSIVYPARLITAYAIGSTDRFDRRNALSGSPCEYLEGPWDDDSIFMAAPGYLVTTTDRYSGTIEDEGTSFAAPLVAGVAGLVYSRRPDLIPKPLSGPPSIIVDILKTSAEDEVGDPPDPGWPEVLWDGPGWSPCYGYGRLNAFRALLSVIRGDFNNNGEINVVDLAMTINQQNGGAAPTLHPGLSDCDCDSLKTPATESDINVLKWHVFDDSLAPAPCFTYDYGGGQ